MWPSEGSVCQAMIPLLARHGIEWIATDEEILGCSTHGKVGRDSRGHVRHPELLYRAWKVREGGPRAGDRLPRPLDVGPGRLPLPAQPRPGRRRRLPRQAARHRRRLPAQPGDARPGDPRRRELLGILPRRRRLVPPLALPGRGARPAHPAGHGRRVPPRAPARTTPCHRLFAGSWISHNFAIWIGHPEDNRGWDALHATRQFLVAEERSRPARPGRPRPGLGRDLHRRGLRLVLVVRRRPLQRPGRACSTTCSASTCATSTRCSAATRPGSLFTPISQAGSHRPIHDQPTSFLNVKVDGRATYFEWIDARPLRLRQRARDDDAGRPRGCSSASGSASTPSGS